MGAKEAVLLLNLGSPDSPSVPDVKEYLREFLMDPRVLDSAYPIRWFVVNGMILPRRPKQSAEAYSKIWTDEGSPLILTSQKQQRLLQERSGLPVYLGMRYGSPSIPEIVRGIKQDGIERLFVIPLYPHYAMSSYETVVVRTMEEIRAQNLKLDISVLQPFYADQDYIDVLVKSVEPYLSDDLDQLLFSFHGIPVRHLKVADSSRGHCQVVDNCCAIASPAHSTCYRHQCLATVDAFKSKSSLDPAKIAVSFQSRLGREPWLSPYTDHTLEQLPKQGVKKLAVLCPAFVSDCLETLEEIDMEGRESFLEAGGESFTFIPCLNEHPAWIEFLNQRVNQWRKGASVANG